MKVRLKNQVTGQLIETKAGFSWTTFFWGAIVCLFRGPYWKGFFLQIVASMLTCGISNLVFPFFINKMNINDLLEKGYVPCTDEDAMVLVSKGIVAASQYNK